MQMTYSIQGKWGPKAWLMIPIIFPQMHDLDHLEKVFHKKVGTMNQYVNTNMHANAKSFFIKAKYDPKNVFAPKVASTPSNLGIVGAQVPPI